MFLVCQLIAIKAMSIVTLQITKVISAAHSKINLHFLGTYVSSPIEKKTHSNNISCLDNLVFNSNRNQETKVV